VPLVIALVPPPSPPEAAAMAYGGMLGDGWNVHGFREQDDVPDEVAGEAEFVMAAASQRVDKALLGRAPRLRMIQIPGHGFDHVDLDACAGAGVVVCTVASSGAESHTVAEMALLLAGVASRKVLAGDSMVRSGSWSKDPIFLMQVGELAGKTLGIVGYGRIGRELAKRARGFDMQVVYFDVVRSEDADAPEFLELNQLLAASDVVSLHAPLTSATRHLINDETIDKMKSTAVLVNTSRGPLVDDDALAHALQSGRIRAAAVDVFDPEPPPADSLLLALDNVVLSPHMAGVTQESVMRIVAAALENIQRVARGQEPHDVVIDDESH
jgi:phosphoglycerate dehydrogenase-like enzyme